MRVRTLRRLIRAASAVVLAGALASPVAACRGEGPTAIADDPTKTKPKAPSKPTTEDAASPAPRKADAPKRHRAVAVACSRLDGAPVVGHAKMAPGPPCATGKDCGPSSRCVYGHCRKDDCYADADCKAGEVCGCDPLDRGHRCLPSGCRVDADCGPGGWCSPTFGLQCGSFHGVIGHQCHTAKDECLDDDECKKPGSSYGYCAFEPKSGRFICGTSECDG